MRVKYATFFGLLFLGILVISPAAAESKVAGNSAYIRDGNTIEIAGVPIRFDGVSTPDRKHYGEQSKQSMQGLLASCQARCGPTSTKAYTCFVGTCSIEDGRNFSSPVVSLDPPSCWVTPGGKAEFLYDIALTSDGLMLRETAILNRTSDRASLPTRGVVLGREISVEQFIAMTRPIYEWSLEHDCRFVVRAFDRTGEETAAYKQLWRALEQRFHIYENLVEAF